MSAGKYGGNITLFEVIQILLILSTILSVTTAALSNNAMGCRMACRRCREKKDSADILEVYCSMCNECKLKRKQQLRGGGIITLTTNGFYPQSSHAVTVPTTMAMYGTYPQDMEIPDYCPPPPECRDEDVPLTLKATTITVATTTTTSTRKPCPTLPCKKRPRRPCNPYPCCIPICPMPCPAACPNALYELSTATSTTTSRTADNKDYEYLYVGFPKELFDEKTS